MEYFAEAYQQLAFISAVLGGLAFTAAAALLAEVAGLKDPQVLGMPAKITAGTSIICSICFIISALMWSFMSADMSRAAAFSSSFPDHIANKNWIPSIMMITGTYLFFTSLGASGWIVNRKLGIITAIAAIIGGIAMVFMIFWFGDIS